MTSSREKKWENMLLVTLEGSEQRLLWELSKLLRQERKRIEEVCHCGHLYWLIYICFRVAVLLWSAGQLLQVLIVLIKQCIRLSSDDEIPISWIGLPALTLQKSPVWATWYNFLIPRLLWWQEINTNRRHCFKPCTSLLWWSLRKTGISQVCWGSVISHL